MDYEIDDYDDYFVDLCQHVFANELILTKIFRHLSLRQLFQCCLVCKTWQTEARRVAANRSQSLQIYHLFRTDHPEDDVVFRDPAIVGEAIDEEMDYCSRVHWVEKYDFKAHVIHAMSEGLWSVPDICLVVYGSLGEDVKLTQRLYHTEMVRKSLPQTGCLVLNLNSQSLIGCPTTSSVPIHKITHFGDLAAVSLLLLPKYKTGSDVTAFSGANMREKVFLKTDIKAIVLFTTSSIFQDNRNLYLDINSLSKFMTGALNSQTAFGGYNSAYFSFNKRDFLNYLVPNEGPPGADDMEARELIGLCFSGPHVRAGSLVLNTKKPNKTEQKLREFRNNLKFEAITNQIYETVVFMFTDEEKNDSFLKLELFRKVFGTGCQVFGISGYGQYGYNYWPTIDSNIGGNNRKNGKRFRNNNYANNNGLKVRPSRVRPRIVLNTNMTTFVVINLRKRFI